jgi:hypothetical protein
MMVHPGDVMTFYGVVTDKRETDGLGYLDLDVGIRIRDGVDAVPGNATVVLPLRDGRPVPYPFPVSAG